MGFVTFLATCMKYDIKFDHAQCRRIVGDGWSAHVAGAIGVSTDAQASWWGGRGIGTVPHGLIAAFGGDTVAAALAFADRFAGYPVRVEALAHFPIERDLVTVIDDFVGKLNDVAFEGGSAKDQAIEIGAGRMQLTTVPSGAISRIGRATPSFQVMSQASSGKMT